jgi:hypothetical protein
MDSTILKNKHHALHQIIRYPTQYEDGTVKNRTLVDPQWSTGTQATPGLPTFRFKIETHNGTKTREYLPIKTTSVIGDYLDNIRGGTWVQIQPLNQDTEISILTITDGSLFGDLNIEFDWDNSIGTDQLSVLENDEKRPSLKRIWNMVEGRSFLQKPFASRPEYQHITNDETDKVKPLIVVNITVWDDALLNVLARSSPDNPHHGNLYVRYRKNILHYYFVYHDRPSANGFVLTYEWKSVFFQRLQPVSNKENLPVYKKLSKMKGKNDWLPLFEDEVQILSLPLSPVTHAKFTLRCHK